MVAVVWWSDPLAADPDYARGKGRPKTKDGLRFITRMPDKLWRVWVTFGTDDYGQHYFGDAAYGGKNSALRNALAFRDKLLRENKIPVREYNGNGWCVKHSRNTSGDVGVCLSKKPAENPYYVAWTVRNVVDGQQKNKSWSIKKHGYAGAWLKAAQARSKHTSQPHSNEPPPPPDWVIAWARDRDIDLYA